MGAIAAALAIALAPGREQIPGAESFVGSVRTPEGYALRAFITRPRGAVGKLPVLFEVAWLSCDSVEQPKGPEDGFTQLLWDLAGRSGFATFRVDKPGVGESAGPKCADLDFTSELAAYRAAFASFKDVEFIDASRVWMIGFSNGGGIAPLVAGDAPVRGYLAFSGWYKTWLEHMLEHERRRLRLAGSSDAEIADRMRKYATFYDLYLNGGQTPGQILGTHPEFKELWSDEPARQYGRPAAFYRQLQQLNLARAWERVVAPVLLVHGEYDWVMSGSDYPLLAAALNARKPGSAEFIEWPRADHGLYTHADERAAFHHDPQQKYDPKLTEHVLRWLRARQ
jgi:pimeloyl-ACP methyl ester carboxylesterase